MESQHEMSGSTTEDDEKKIYVTHITIRQSISVLLLKLILIEIMATTAIILFHTFIISTNVVDVAASIAGNFKIFNIPLFLSLVFAKICLTLFVIIGWLNNYYEITPRELIHKKGFIFKKEEKHTLNHLISVKIEHGIMGRIFNYGTLNLYNKELKKDMIIYAIHNPIKYHHILQNLLPAANQEKAILREHILEAVDEAV